MANFSGTKMYSQLKNPKVDTSYIGIVIDLKDFWGQDIKQKQPKKKILGK